MEVYTIGTKEQLKILRRIATPIENIDGVAVKLALDMVDTMVRARGLGLAGPQVGMLQRIFTVKISHEKPMVFINPVIIATSQETDSLEEGCLSVPEQYAGVKRPMSVQVQAWNEQGRPFTIETAGLLARVIQHELDHLNGVLFVDHLSAGKRKKILGCFNINPDNYPEIE